MTLMAIDMARGEFWKSRRRAVSLRTSDIDGQLDQDGIPLRK
jgi:hypothetical protein